MSARLRLPVVLTLLFALIAASCSGGDGKNEDKLHLAGDDKAALRRGPDGRFPRLLIQGWMVVSSDEQNNPKFDDPAQRSHHFEAKLARGGSELDVNLYENDAAENDRMAKDRIRESEEQHEATVFGYPGTIIKYRNGGGYGLLWFADGISYSLSFDGKNRDRFFDAVNALRVVAEDQWEAALPETSVKSSARAQEVDRMLAGIPQPPNFTVDDLRRGPAISRDSLGIEVTRVAACGWIESWSAARRAGNAAAEKAAVEAMATSRQWPILHEIQSVPSWPKAIWSYAGPMGGDGRMGVQTVEQSAVNGLSCRLSG